jgi:hypothetical protein
MIVPRKGQAVSTNIGAPKNQLLLNVFNMSLAGTGLKKVAQTQNGQM